MENKRTFSINLGLILNLTADETKKVFEVITKEIDDDRLSFSMQRAINNLFKLYEKTGSLSYLILGGVIIGRILSVYEILEVLNEAGMDKETKLKVIETWYDLIHKSPKKFI